MLDCAEVQAALSARLDGEDAGIDDDLIDAHVSGCADCQAYFDCAAALNRRLTIGAATAAGAPDLTDQILAGISPSEAPRRLSASPAVLGRLLLVPLGMAFVLWAFQQVVVASTPLPFGEPDPQRTALLIDSAAIRMAFGFALVFAAWKPRLAGGMLPIFAAVTMFSLGFGIRDVLVGEILMSSIWGWLLHILATVALAWVWLSSLGFIHVQRTVQSLGAGPVR